MALWQLMIEVMPSERVAGRRQIESDEFDEALWWSDRQPPAGFRERLSALLPPTKSWHDQLLWFGSEDGDRIDVWMKADRVESIGVRIDCRNANPSFAQKLLLTVQDWSCSLVELRYFKVLPDTPTAFIHAIADSPSCRFMEDPAYWLPKLAAEVREAEAEN